VEIGVIEGGDPVAPHAAPRADLLVLDDTSVLLAARNIDAVLDTLLFAGNTNLVRDVMVNGAWAVRDFHHHDEQRIAARYRETVQRLGK